MARSYSGYWPGPHTRISYEVTVVSQDCRFFIPPLPLDCGNLPLLTLSAKQCTSTFYCFCTFLVLIVSTGQLIHHLKTINHQRLFSLLYCIISQKWSFTRSFFFPILHFQLYILYMSLGFWRTELSRVSNKFIILLV